MVGSIVTDTPREKIAELTKEDTTLATGEPLQIVNQKGINGMRV